MRVVQQSGKRLVIGRNEICARRVTSHCTHRLIFRRRFQWNAVWQQYVDSSWSVLISMHIEFGLVACVLHGSFGFSIPQPIPTMKQKPSVRHLLRTPFWYSCKRSRGDHYLSCLPSNGIDPARHVDLKSRFSDAPKVYTLESVQEPDCARVVTWRRNWNKERPSRSASRERLIGSRGAVGRLCERYRAAEWAPGDPARVDALRPTCRSRR